MKTPLLILFALLLSVAAFYSIASRQQHADLMIINAVIYTVDNADAKAEAVAVRGSRIIAVGTTQDIQKHYTSQNVIDAQGKTVVPGLIDSHAHVLGLGLSLSEVNLYGTESPQQIVELVAEKVKQLKPGEWIRGRGWDQNDWGKGMGQRPFPTAAQLDKVSPNNPVVLKRVDGHAVWVNSKAMEVAKRSTDLTTEVDGGMILRDRMGNPNGIFIDNAVSIIESAVPDYSLEEKTGLYDLALKECLRNGITGVHDMGIDESGYKIYRTLASHRRLPIRINAFIGGNGALLNRMFAEGPFIDHVNKSLTVRSVKIYLDGAMGSRGAALIEPYSDETNNRGLITFPPDSIRVITEQALENGFQVGIHAIGDRANKIALDAFEKASQKNPLKARSARMRIEHAQVIAPEDIHRFKQLNVIPSMQPTHATSDMYWVQSRLGPDRVLGSYAWRSLLDDGNIIPSGSDFPVENPNPLLGFYAAVSRQDTRGIPNTAEDVAMQFQLSAEGIRDSSNFSGGWFPGQKMTRQEALRSFTLWGAYAEFMEGEKGSIEEGKLADLVILSKDIMSVPLKEIPATEVEMTIVGGIIRYQKK
ncbi:MAG: amidohydrolase [Bacteroidota bacterium]